MPRYGRNLYDVVKSQGNILSRMSVFELGLQLLNILELIHNSGYVYNDLKLENIVLGANDIEPNLLKNPLDGVSGQFKINLIDFGLASKWLDVETGKHIE